MANGGHYFKLEYPFMLRGRRKIVGDRDGIFFTEDDALAEVLDHPGTHGCTRVDGGLKAAYQAKRRHSLRDPDGVMGRSSTTRVQPVRGPERAPVPTLEEIRAAGYKDPQAILDRLKAELAKGDDVKGDDQGALDPEEEAELEKLADSGKEAGSNPASPDGSKAESGESGDSGVTADDVGKMTKAELRDLLTDLKVEQPVPEAKVADLKAAALAALQPAEPAPAEG